MDIAFFPVAISRSSICLFYLLCSFSVKVEFFSDFVAMVMSTIEVFSVENKKIFDEVFADNLSIIRSDEELSKIILIYQDHNPYVHA